MVVVFGSINLDLVTRVERFPAPGETLSGGEFATHAGGKGGNQALAAARAGAKVRMFGAVGRDSFAGTATALLRAGGVDLRGVATIDSPTGCATILVDAKGENCIVVIAGANAHVDEQAVADEVLSRDTLLVLQHEVPATANAALITRAWRAGARIILNGAPARAVAPELLRQIDVLVVNEGEAAVLAGACGWPTHPEAFATSAASRIADLTVIVTLGAAGALCCVRGQTVRAATPRVEVVDTTGAGDAFVGALAAALDRGVALPEAMRFAVAAGSLACTMHGAQSALPQRAAVEALLPLVTVTPR
ncbi:MAG: ribokinase [Casimicrobiaceae bacterium]